MRYALSAGYAYMCVYVYTVDMVSRSANHSNVERDGPLQPVLLSKHYNTIQVSQYGSNNKINGLWKLQNINVFILYTETGVSIIPFYLCNLFFFFFIFHMMRSPAILLAVYAFKAIFFCPICRMFREKNYSLTYICCMYSILESFFPFHRLLYKWMFIWLYITF